MKCEYCAATDATIKRTKYECAVCDLRLRCKTVVCEDCNSWYIPQRTFWAYVGRRRQHDETCKGTLIAIDGSTRARRSRLPSDVR